MACPSIINPLLMQSQLSVGILAHSMGVVCRIRMCPFLRPHIVLTTLRNNATSMGMVTISIEKYTLNSYVSLAWIPGHKLSHLTREL